MKRNNILVIFDDETRVVYAPQSSVRIANRGPSDNRIKDYEQVQTRPPLWFGFQNFEARILAAGHQMLTHRGFRKVEIGRASGRARVCQYVYNSVWGGSLNKKYIE